MKQHRSTMRVSIQTPPENGRPAARSLSRLGFRLSCFLLLLAACGCTVLTYSGANGERFSRRSFGATTSIAALAVHADTNGIRRVELQGYRNDSNQALTTVTEAAVRAALQAR